MKKDKNLQEAVAVRYDPEKEDAPRVIAKGKGELANRIIETAQKNNIPIYEDKDLVVLLAAVELFDEVPPELYVAVAEILVWVYRMNDKNKTNADFGNISSFRK